MFILFLIIDFLPLNQLNRITKVSRGIYWLAGNPLILVKFQTQVKDIKIEQFDHNPPTPKQLQHAMRIKKSKRKGVGIFGHEFINFKINMDRKFV